MSFTILYYILARPSQAIGIVRQRNPFLLSLIVIILAYFSRSLSASLHRGSTLGPASIDFTLGTAANFFAALLVLICFTALFHFTADFYGGRGRAKDLFYSFCLSLLPFILLLPLTLIWSSLYIIAWIVLWLWTIILKIVCVKEVYQFSYPEALATMILPLIILAALLGFTLLFGISSLIGYFNMM